MKLFDFIFGSAVNRRMASFQDRLMERHVAEVENIYRQMRGWRHDYHSHLQTIKAYRAMGREEELNDYLELLEADLTAVDTVIKSGNIMVDAMLNSKLSLAKSRGIAVNAKAVVPKSIGVSEVDLCVLVGNLLDNAMEACAGLPADKRFIRVYMDMKKDNLYMCVTNSSGGVKKENGRYISSKGGNHGFGLIRADRIVKKYGGYIKRGDEEGAFTSEVLLPVTQ